MLQAVPAGNDMGVATYLLHHRHESEECPAAYAAWKGFDSPLRGQEARSSCRWGGHEIWWDLKATDAGMALAKLPHYVAERSEAVRVGPVVIP